MFIDSHAHFDLMLSGDKSLSEESIMASLAESRVSRCVQVAIEPQGFEWARDFALRHREKGILFTLGLHPSTPAGEKNLRLLSIAANEAVRGGAAPLLFGIGECGLDYYRMRRPADEQMESFESQIALAVSLGLPVIIHSRDAMDDTVAVLKKYAPLTGIMHCFPGNAAEASRCLDLGLHLSFAGNITYKSARDIQEAAAYAPDDRILLETDSPFLTPEPERGKKNRPDYVASTYSFISNLREEPLLKTVKYVRENFESLMGKHEPR